MGEAGRSRGADEARGAIVNGLPRVLALKARALVTPTPFRWIDPTGEEARVGEILAVLGLPKEIPESDRELLERCARDAHDAHVGEVEGEKLLAGAARPRATMLNPWSAKDEPNEPVDVGASHAKFIERLREVPRTHSEEWYRDLWFRVLDEDVPGVPAVPWLPDHTVWAHRNMTAALVGARANGDSPCLLALHVGPVQGFIADARRTHDLWTGSFTVAWLTFEALRTLAVTLGPESVVQPHFAGAVIARKLLFREPREYTPGEVLRLPIPNRILAIVPARRAQEIAEDTLGNVGRTWECMSDAVLKHFRAHGHESDFVQWREQVAQHPEIDAVVQPWPATLTEINVLLQGAGDSVRIGAGQGDERPGIAYGRMFNLTHRTLTAHRSVWRVPFHNGDARPKCTQCGVREQMGPLTETASAQKRTSREFFETLGKKLRERGATGRDDERASLKLTVGEGLCAVCLTKRFVPEVYFGGEAVEAGLGLDWRKPEDRRALRFPSVATIATAPFRWKLVEALPQDDALRSVVRRWSKSVGDACGQLDFHPPGNLLGAFEELGRRADDNARAVLEHEGQWFYEASYEPRTAWRDHRETPPPDGGVDMERLAESLPPGRRALQEMVRSVGFSPSHYYAVLMLDGDDMGQWLTGTHEKRPRWSELIPEEFLVRDPALAAELGDKCRTISPAVHGELSRRLANLAQRQHEIVARHLGRVVYSGGDDLLAFLPLHTVLPCAMAIREEMRKREHLGDRFDISAGVAVAHYRDPLGLTLREARRAEKYAKKTPGKGAFQVRVLKRSGAPLRVTLPWTFGSGRSTVDALVRLEDARVRLEDAREDARGDSREDRHPLANVKVARELEIEAATLADESLRGAFFHRVRRLVRPDADADALVTFLDAARYEPSRVVDILLLVGFFVRTRRELDVGALLQSVARRAEP